ncbi:unnamed protein product [Rotaria sordida]|uniref:Uncharacterized protein n=1 Tax=Rotaria sordida TaxID=392033 RepID=A0A814Z5R7_9BILA|nr:unnamed protein product [Rotaria sordida]
MAKNMTCSNSNDDHLCNIQSSFSTNTISDNSDYLFSKLDVKSYGTITFPQNNCNQANFIRISPDVCPTQVRELFIGQNYDTRPSLVISIMGSAKESSLRSKLFRIFREGLLQVAQTTNVWIITAGLNSRVTRFFGEIIRTNSDPSRPIYLIGITSWGCISNVSQLDVHDTNVIYSKLKSDEKEATPLEANHTHFIFIDDKTKYKHGCAIKFRARFERAISGEGFSLQTMTNNNQIKDKSIRSYSQSKQSDNMPVVVVVIEGCADAIKKVYQSAVKDRIPVVLVEGTGGCCDLFAKCYHLYNEYKSKMESCAQTNENSSSLIEQNEQIKNKIREALQIVNHEMAETSCTNAPDEGLDFFELIYECVETRNIFLNFIDFKVHDLSGEDVNFSILQALLKVTSGNDSCKTKPEEKREQLNLAYEWKQIDIIKNSIMKDERDWKKIELNDLFLKALIENQANFVELYLDHDFPLHDLFENKNQILDLYKIENIHFKNELNSPLRSIYSEIIQPFIDNHSLIDADCDPDNLATNSKNDSSSIISEIDIDKELFLWSVVTGRHELAFLFWTRGRNKICAAFIAILIYKSKAKKEKNLKYYEWADQLEYFAVEILEKFYSTNPLKCKQAIVRAVPEFDNVTWLQLAVLAESKSFIAKKGAQAVLKDIWYGRIDHHVGHSLIIFSSFMLWYSVFLPYYEENNTYNQPDVYQNFQDRSDIFHFRTSRSKPAIDKVCTMSDATCSRLMDDGFDEDTKSVTVANAGCWKRINIGSNQYIKNVSMFLHAPYVKYLHSLYSHLIFLILFSYVILYAYFPRYEFQSDRCFLNEEEHNNSETKSISNLTNINMTINVNSSSKSNLQSHYGPSASELILILWVFTLFCEEIRQIRANKAQSLYKKIKKYFSIFWNKLDALAIILFILGCILRFLPINQCFCFARIVLAIDLCLWYIRTLDIFSAIKRLGPKLVMIGEMIHDLKFFMLMLTVFILAFGVPAYSLLDDVEKHSWHLPRYIINFAYWQIFGELQEIDQIEKNYELSGYVIFFLLVAYMTVANILLINLLIAMFSNTFDRLHSDTNCIWKFQQYSLVCYELKRPLLPPPLIIISHIWRIIIYIFSHIIRINWFYMKYIEEKNQAKKIKANKILTKQIEEIEDALGHEIYFFSLKNNQEQIGSNEERIYSPQEISSNKIKTLENQIQIIQNQQSNMFQYLESLMSGIKKIGGNDIEKPK